MALLQSRFPSECGTPRSKWYTKNQHQKGCQTQVATWIGCLKNIHGKVGIQYKKELPPRDDIIEYNPEVHVKQIKGNVEWHGCPPEHKIVLRAIIEKLLTPLPKNACRITFQDSNSTLTSQKMTMAHGDLRQYQHQSQIKHTCTGPNLSFVCVSRIA